MAPIKVGILGLSASGTSGTGWAARAHLAYLRASPKYDLIALSNSSVESAKLAIKKFELPESTRAYGNAQDLASDPDVELVVCSTRVDKHGETILPSLRKGKNVFCEWPLGKDLAEAEEILSVAKSKNVRTMVGLQGRFSLPVAKLKEVIASGRIGEVLSTTFVGSPGNAGADESASLAYFADRKIGGNIETIAVGHSIDFITGALGEFESFNSLLATQRPRVPVVDRSTNKVVDTIDRTSFDHIIISGELQSKSAVKPVLSYIARGGKPFPGSDKSLLWNIYGTKGEVQILSPAFFLNVDSPDTEIWLYENDKEKPEKLEMVEDEFLNTLPQPGHNIGKLYELYAEDKGGYPTFEHAVLRHKFINEMDTRHDQGTQVQKAKYSAA